MSSDERERSHLVRGFVEARMGQREASERLGIGVRQFKRLVRAWKQDGDAGLVSRQRGRPSNRRLNDERRADIVALLRDKYAGFGATLASEKLLGLDGIEVSVETVRQMQISLGLWKPKARRAKRVFQLRERRPRFGELIQIDGSPHDWFEGRGPRCTLIVFIDDATGRLAALRFAPVESGQAYLEALRDHVLGHGCPLAFYSDRHGIFRVNAKDAQSGDGKTEFGRVVERLEIGLINALTPQAKGKVERPFRTVKDAHETLYHFHEPETEAEANRWLARFIATYNRGDHRSEPHARIDDWLAHLPPDGVRQMCAWERFCAFAREPERRLVGIDCRLTVAGVTYEVDAELAGETVVVWWGLFDQELWVEHGDERMGPFHPVGGPIPLHRYRKHRKSRQEVRADQVAALASKLALPRAALSGENAVAMTGVPREVDAAAIRVRPFQDPDPFHELVFANPIAARRAIADEVRVPLATLSDDDRAFIDALLNRTLVRPDILTAIRDRFPQGRRGGVGRC